MTQNIKSALGTLLGTLFLISTVEAAPVSITLKGNVYEWTKKKGRGDLLFRHTRTDVESPEETKTDSLYVDTVGRTVVREHLESKDGKPTLFFFERPQTDESGKIEVKDGKAHYTHTVAGKTKTDTTDAPESFVFPPTFLLYVQKHWKDFLAGESINMRLAVLEMRDDFGFKFFKVAQDEVQGKTFYSAKLKPTSLIISAIVDPIEFTLDDQKRVKSVRGRMPMKKKTESGDLEDFVGEITYGNQ